MENLREPFQFANLSQYCQCHFKPKKDQEPPTVSSLMMAHRTNFEYEFGPVYKLADAGGFE